MMGGQLAALFDSLPAALPFVKSGQVRVLAVSTAKRDAALPQVPTLAESGLAGFDVLGWLGLVGPAGLPVAIRDKVNQDLQKALATEDVKDRLAKIGMQVVGGSPDAFGKFIASEYQRWGDVIKSGGLKAD
jgi:tripartite-type tricarboxylate transporter receptor subunit TctC